MADLANNTCRTLCDSSKFQQPNSPLSYFFTVTIAQAQTKIRIKIPSMLGKTMQRRSYDFQGSDAEENHKRDIKKRVTSRKIFTKKVGLMFCKVFGQKKTAETCSNGENGKVCSNGDGNSGGLADGKMAKIWEKFGFDDMEHSRIKSRGNYVNGEEKQSGNAAEEGRKPKRQQQASLTNNKQGQVTFKNFINKRQNGLSSFGSNRRSSSSSANVVGTTDFLIRKLESSLELPRVPSRILASSQMLANREESEELCKKRILMGGKCRPLNNSGILQYDKDGILLPDNLPP